MTLNEFLLIAFHPAFFWCIGAATALVLGLLALAAWQAWQLPEDDWREERDRELEEYPENDELPPSNTFA